MQKLQTRTDRKLISMFTENTGRHMLDSGGAYGRNWERNQRLGKSLKAWNARPDVSVSSDDTSIEVTIDCYKFLRRAISYTTESAKLTRAFRRFALSGERKNDSWDSCLNEYAKLNNWKVIDGCNSYNGECLLSQTIQFSIIETDDQAEFVVLQIHGGCDVRGGYTDPVFFEQDYEGSIYRYNDLYCQVAPAVVYDPNQLEIIPDLPRDAGTILYTDDGYHWYGDDIRHEVKAETLFSFDTEAERPTWAGRPCEFYI